MKNIKYTNKNYTPKQLKLPLEIERIIEISDSIYSFSEIMDCIDITPYFADKKGCKTGRPRCSYTKLLKIILFAFMENGYVALRGIEKLCKTDIRYMWLLDDIPAPTFATIGNFIRDCLTTKIEDIFLAINKVIFEKEHVDLTHAYIDRTKIEANANKYTWVWKKSSIKNRENTFEKISKLIDKINTEDLASFQVKIEKRNEYVIEYLEEIIVRYQELLNIDKNAFVHGSGKRKTNQIRWTY